MNTDDRSQTSLPEPLTNRPERRPRRKLAALVLLLLGLLVLVGGVGALTIVLARNTIPDATRTGPQGTATPHGKSGALAPGCTSERLPLDTVRQQTASGLHLNVAQVRAQVQNSKTISQIATHQGITQQQLRAIEIQALRTANSRWLAMSCSTQKDVDSNMQRDVGSAAYMDSEFTDLFR